MGSTGASVGRGGRARTTTPTKTPKQTKRGLRPAPVKPAPGRARGQAVSRQEFERATGRTVSGRRTRRGR